MSEAMDFYPIEPPEMHGETPKQPQLGDEKWKRLAACPPDPSHWPCRSAVRIATDMSVHGRSPLSLLHPGIPIMCDPCGPQSARHPSMILEASVPPANRSQPLAKVPPGLPRLRASLNPALASGSYSSFLKPALLCTSPTIASLIVQHRAGTVSIAASAPV